MSKKQNEWRALVKKTYHKNKKRNRNYTFTQALKDAARLRKRGGGGEEEDDEEPMTGGRRSRRTRKRRS
jgi:hypothetical protein